MTRRRPQILTVAAVILFLTGGAWLMDAQDLAPLPPLLTDPVPQAATLFGILGIAAGIGVLGVRSWARLPGTAVVVVDLSRTLLLLPAALAAAGSAGPAEVLVTFVLGLLLPGTVAGFAVYALVWRWPVPGTPEPVASATAMPDATSTRR
jgi:hypothetical protein